MKSPKWFEGIMKRKRTPALFFLGVLIIAKLILGSVFLYRAGSSGHVMAQSTAIASGPPNVVTKTDAEKAAEDGKNTIDIKFLIRKKTELEQEERRLAKKEAELKAIQEDINEKIRKLTLLRDEIRAEIDRKTAAEDQKFKHLIKVFSAMKPQNAADLIEKLDKKLAIALLSKMKGDSVGQILSYVDIDKAAKISEGLVKKE